MSRGSPSRYAGRWRGDGHDQARIVRAYEKRQRRRLAAVRSGRAMPPILPDESVRAYTA